MHWIEEGLIWDANVQGMCKSYRDAKCQRCGNGVAREIAHYGDINDCIPVGERLAYDKEKEAWLPKSKISDVVYLCSGAVMPSGMVDEFVFKPNDVIELNQWNALESLKDKKLVVEGCDGKNVWFKDCSILFDVHLFRKVSLPRYTIYCDKGSLDVSKSQNGEWVRYADIADIAEVVLRSQKKN